MYKQNLHAANIQHEWGEFQIEAWVHRWSRGTNFKWNGDALFFFFCVYICFVYIIGKYCQRSKCVQFAC